MKLSGYKSQNQQLRLWDEPLGNHGHVRTVLGAFAEELTASLFGGRRHRTMTGVDYCPDVSVGEVYLEVKTMGRSLQTWIYSGRLEKDIAFSAAYPLLYCIWKHATDSSQAVTVDGLKDLFLRSLQAVYLVPFSTMHQISQAAPRTPCNSKYYGKHNCPSDSLYGEATRIKLADIESFPHYCLELDREEVSQAANANGSEVISDRAIQGRRSKRISRNGKRLEAVDRLVGI